MVKEALPYISRYENSHLWIFVLHCNQEEQYKHLPMHQGLNISTDCESLQRYMRQTLQIPYREKPPLG